MLFFVKLNPEFSSKLGEEDKATSVIIAIIFVSSGEKGYYRVVSVGLGKVWLLLVVRAQPPYARQLLLSLAQATRGDLEKAPSICSL